MTIVTPREFAPMAAEPLAPQALAHAWDVLLQRLPLHAEEGTRREQLAERDLVLALHETGLSGPAAAVLVASVRRQFEVLALLDPLLLLEHAQWAFVSFPASLLARSWLSALAAPAAPLLPAGSWGPDAPEPDREAQRAWLRAMESARVRADPQAQPIRVVHVAWAWIRLGDRFLLHRREDKARAGQKSFGLPGGRFNLDDVPLAEQARADILRELLRVDSPLVAAHVHRTLARELHEELDLTPGLHYVAAPFGEPLPPYDEVNGAGNRHAYSRYVFHLFSVRLTHAGETRLLAQLARAPQQLQWFSADELQGPQRANGDSAYVDALHRAWPTGMAQMLARVPASEASVLPYVSESHMLDLPGDPHDSGGVFKCGKPGKERAVAPTQALAPHEWALLLMLGWHARGEPIDDAAEPAPVISRLGQGWVHAPALLPLALGLLGKTERVLPGLLEIREGCWIGLRIAPALVFLPPTLFAYQIRGSQRGGGVLQVDRRAVDTPWGRLSGAQYRREINGNTVATLRQLEKGDEPAGDWERSLREQFGEGLKALGLRRLWSTKGNQCGLVDGLLRSTNAGRAAQGPAPLDLR